MQGFCLGLADLSNIADVVFNFQFILFFEADSERQTQPEKYGFSILSAENLLEPDNLLPVGLNFSPTLRNLFQHRVFQACSDKKLLKKSQQIRKHSLQIRNQK